MSGVNVIRFLLANNVALAAVVPATQIKPGVLPLKTPKPCISVTQISSVPQNLINVNDPHKMHIDRIQVTGLHNNYADLKAVMKLVLAACPCLRNGVNGTREIDDWLEYFTAEFLNMVTVDSITPQAEGPDLYDDVTNTHESSRDFIVRWIS